MVGEQFGGSWQHSQLDEENHTDRRNISEFMSGITET